MDPPPIALSTTPVRHPDCCLSLSSTLLQLLFNILSALVTQDQTSTVLSIGSGTGLLERVLADYIAAEASRTSSSPAQWLSIEGVEVQPESQRPVNKYLVEPAINLVRGTWQTASRLQDSDVTALMFVYPRQPSLVTQYMKCVARVESPVLKVVWLGPRADWAEFEGCFTVIQGNAPRRFFRRELENEDVGLDNYEMIVAFEREPEKV